MKIEKDKKKKINQSKMSDHPLSPQRANIDSLGIEGSSARASDRRNRGPLSMTSNSIFNHVTKNQILDGLASSYRDMVLLEQDRIGNDDYFPQGEEYEDEIGLDYGQLQKEFPNKRVSRDEDMDLRPRSLSYDGTSFKDLFESLSLKNDPSILLSLSV